MRLQGNEEKINAELIDVKKRLENADQRRIHETNELKRQLKNLSRGEPITVENSVPVQAAAKPFVKPTPRQKT